MSLPVLVLHSVNKTLNCLLLGACWPWGWWVKISSTACQLTKQLSNKFRNNLQAYACPSWHSGWKMINSADPLMHTLPHTALGLWSLSSKGRNCSFSSGKSVKVTPYVTQLCYSLLQLLNCVTQSYNYNYSTLLLKVTLPALAHSHSCCSPYIVKYIRYQEGGG